MGNHRQVQLAQFWGPLCIFKRQPLLVNKSQNAVPPSEPTLSIGTVVPRLISFSPIHPLNLWLCALHNPRW